MITFYTEEPYPQRNVIFLWHDNWDDYSFKTLYSLLYYDNNGVVTPLGNVKIGQKKLEVGTPNLPTKFTDLGESFFSLGMDVEYYSNIKKLGLELREYILQSLNDVAFDNKILEEAMTESCMITSLMRGVTYPLIVGQFKRVALGGDVLSEYKFTYTYPLTIKGRNNKSPQLNFHVIPESNPPTNIHIVIGSNGVGKTFLINNMIKSLLEPTDTIFIDDTTIEGDLSIGKFSFEFSELYGETSSFVNIISVAFSAFDNTEVHPNREADKNKIGYSYVGLKKKLSQDDLFQHKTTEELVEDFYTSLMECKANESKRSRWLQMISILESDPLILSLGIRNNIDYDNDNIVKESFAKLSSGHKIIVLTVTKLVELTVEKSLIILDEPESHLHPPLLSSFIRSISVLMIQMNAVAIIATHSPVVIQEVPKKCVWKISRNGEVTNIERVEVETFGENVGLLTNEIFGLEVTSAGFYKMLQVVVEESDSYEDAKEKFGGELGGEAMAILRNMMHLKSQK